MKKRNIFVIGLGRFGLSLIDELSSYSDEIVGIDSDEEAVEQASHIISQAYIADSTSDKAMKDAGVQNADHVIIAFGSSFEGTVMTYVTLKDLGVKNITVRCDKESYIPILKKLGVTDIISPTKIAGTRLATRIAFPNFVDYFSISDDYCIVEIPVPQTFKPLTVEELNPRNRFSVNLLLIQRNKVNIAPKANDEIRPGDELVIFGLRKNILALSDQLND